MSGREDFELVDQDQVRASREALLEYLRRARAAGSRQKRRLGIDERLGNLRRIQLAIASLQSSS